MSNAHSYGKTFLGKRIGDYAEARRETFSAQVVEVLPSQRSAWVRIQGATEKVLVHYSLNWRLTPEHLKPGNGVLCGFREGSRGHMEIIGHGLVVPTPIAGSPAVVVPSAPDAILSGCQVIALPEIEL
jgi:hypothetical protein